MTLTIDEAIKRFSQEAEVCAGNADNYTRNKLSEFAAVCAKEAAENGQLAEWLTELKARRLLMDMVCGELAELYGSPCQEPKAEEFMRKNGFCEDCKIIFSDKECWFRYFQRKIKQNWIGEAESLKLIGDDEDER